jgi:hypothetical protein
MTSTDPDVTAAIREDNGLYDLGWYLGWNPTCKHATLDGKFTAKQLRAIADHMDKYRLLGGHEIVNPITRS